ncbi:MAG TPA: hydroxymethylbilane synthase [Gemmatimonadales bacterium]|jgi:hydroxymethylbilane synthase|nr:hydroxymethylbilane synthase [Gemmatimonadales bacterium]
MSRTLRLGTRGSPLALWQARRIQALLERAGTRTELVTIRTTGDLIAQVPLARIGTVALFTAQLDEALLAERIDLAVHSLKDLPTGSCPGIEIAGVSEREDPRDALVGRGPIRWGELPRGATIATSSLRRRAELLRARPDLDVVEIRGNVDSRLAKLDATPAWTATVLATAGLLRLGLGDRIGERLPFDLMLPAPGQGALAVTTRDGDRATALVVRSAVHHVATALCVAAERALLGRLEGGCQVPVGAFARVVGEAGAVEVELTARVVSLDGAHAVERSVTAPAADEAAAARLGEALAAALRQAGAEPILERARAAAPPAEVTEP